jgi:hypothetical protein
MRAWLSFALCGLAAGCTAILDPERIDDVYRCEFDGQCPVHEDPRFDNVCTTDDDTSRAPKICAPAPAVSCDPHEYDETSEFVALFRAVMAEEDRYEMQCDDLGPVQGCPVGFGECPAGLSVHDRSGRCDDDDPGTPPALAPIPEVGGQDVLDQFCRATFCNDRFVCDTSEHRCVPCLLGEPLGRGGCGDLYLGGERSSVYTSTEELDVNCMGPDSTEENITFGPLVAKP